MFNYGKCSRRMLLLCFSTQVYLRRVFKMSAFGINVSLNATGQWMPQCALFNAVSNVYLQGSSRTGTHGNAVPVLFRRDAIA